MTSGGAEVTIGRTFRLDFMLIDNVWPVSMVWVKRRRRVELGLRHEMILRVQ
jgi:hypothetical protein